MTLRLPSILLPILLRVLFGLVALILVGGAPAHDCEHHDEAGPECVLCDHLGQDAPPAYVAPSLPRIVVEIARVPCSAAPRLRIASQASPRGPPVESA